MADEIPLNEDQQRLKDAEDEIARIRAKLETARANGADDGELA